MIATTSTSNAIETYCAAEEIEVVGYVGAEEPNMMLLESH